MSRLVTGFGGISCYYMAWLLFEEIVKRDAVSSLCGITYFSMVANFLSIAFALGEASSK